MTTVGRFTTRKTFITGDASPRQFAVKQDPTRIYLAFLLPTGGAQTTVFPSGSTQTAGYIVNAQNPVLEILYSRHADLVYEEWVVFNLGVGVLLPIVEVLENAAWNASVKIDSAERRLLFK